MCKKDEKKKMTIEPIKRHISGPAQTLEEKAEVLLGTINLYIIRNDPDYCKRTIENVKWFYSKNKKEIPLETKERIYKIEKILEG